MRNNKFFSSRTFIGLVSILVGFVLPLFIFSFVINYVVPKSVFPGQYEHLGPFLILYLYYILPFPFVMPTTSSFVLYKFLTRRYAGNSVRKVSDTPEDEVKITMPPIKDRLLYSAKALCVSLVFKIPAWIIFYGPVVRNLYSQNPLLDAVFLLMFLIGSVGMLGDTVALVVIVLVTFNIKDTKRFRNISFFSLVFLWYLALSAIPTTFFVFIQSTLFQFQDIIDWVRK